MTSVISRHIAELQAEESRLAKRLDELRKDIGELTEGSTRGAPVRASDWVNEPIPEHRWLVGNMIAASTTTMLVAESGLGKTTMLTQLTISLSLGRKFCEMECSRVRTLTVEAEGARYAYRSRFLDTCKALGVNPGLIGDWYVHPPHITDYELGSRGLYDMIRGCKPRVVVLDTLGYFHSGDENDASDWKRNVMRPIRKLTAEFGCAFILVHHSGKDLEKGGRGSSAQLADVDHYLVLDHPVGTTEPYRELYVRKNKYGKGKMRIPLRFYEDEAVFRPTPREAAVVVDPLRRAKGMVPCA